MDPSEGQDPQSFFRELGPGWSWVRAERKPNPVGAAGRACESQSPESESRRNRVLGGVPDQEESAVASVPEVVRMQVKVKSWA